MLSAEPVLHTTSQQAYALDELANPLMWTPGSTHDNRGERGYRSFYLQVPPYAAVWEESHSKVLDDIVIKSTYKRQLRWLTCACNCEYVI